MKTLLSVVLCLGLFGCGNVVVEEPEPEVEETPAVEEPEPEVVFDPGDAPDPFVPVEEPATSPTVVVEDTAPVDRAGRPIVDADGNPIPVEEREVPTQ